MPIGECKCKCPATNLTSHNLAGYSLLVEPFQTTKQVESDISGSNNACVAWPALFRNGSNRSISKVVEQKPNRMCQGILKTMILLVIHNNRTFDSSSSLLL